MYTPESRLHFLSCHNNALALVPQSLDLGAGGMSACHEPGSHLPQPHSLPIQEVSELLFGGPLSPCCSASRACFAAATESIEPSRFPSLFFSTATELKTMEKSPSWSPKKLR